MEKENKVLKFKYSFKMAVNCLISKAIISTKGIWCLLFQVLIPSDETKFYDFNENVF